MTMMRISLLLALTLAAGCTLQPTIQPVATAPKLSVDEQASQLDAYGTSNIFKMPEVRGLAVRKAMTEALVQATKSGQAPANARFRANVKVVEDQWPLLACLIVLTLVGCPSHINEVQVDLVTEIDGKVYRGSGAASRVGGAYYRGEDAAIMEATTLALKEALSK